MATLYSIVNTLNCIKGSQYVIYIKSKVINYLARLNKRRHNSMSALRGMQCTSICADTCSLASLHSTATTCLTNSLIFISSVIVTVFVIVDCVVCFCVIVVIVTDCIFIILSTLQNTSSSYI